MRRTLIVLALLAACGADGDPQKPAPRGAPDPTATGGDWLPLPGRFAETLPPEIVWGL